MNTSDYIPFINTGYDCQSASLYYADAFAMRVGLEQIDEIRPKLPSGPKRWVDASIDGLNCKSLSALSNSYRAYLNKFDGYQQIADQQFQKNPIKNVAEQFVFSVLDYCKSQGPDWISVPQLPLTSDTSRNKINRLFADFAAQWRTKTGYHGKLILPVIFTNQSQINRKTERNKKIACISACISVARADGIWVVDSTLNDQEGSGKFDERFPALIKFHEELNDKIPQNTITIGGPYWGMNLVLWARGCVHFPAIGLGGSYQYYIPGQPMRRKANIRVAIRPLRRCAWGSPPLKGWLSDTVNNLAPTDPARVDFSTIEKDWARLQIGSNAKLETAAFYKNWFNKFSTLPQAGRALALYQDLSSGYVLGKTLKPLPDKREGTARRPERVAQQLMMNCL